MASEVCLAARQETCRTDAKEADILQREYNLKEQQYYSDPNTAMREQYDRKDLNDTKALIDEKNAAVVAGQAGHLGSRRPVTRIRRRSRLGHRTEYSEHEHFAASTLG